jgi:hypothetical protein
MYLERKKSTLYLYSKCAFLQFKVGENSPPPKKITGEISAKNKNNFFGT